MSTPYIGFSNETLRSQPELRPGDEVDCPKCKGRHTVEGSKPALLLFYRCGSDSYLAGVNGRSTMGARSDVSGKI